MEFPGGGGSTVRPSGTENAGGWGGQTGKTLRGGGMDIFWNHTFASNQCGAGSIPGPSIICGRVCCWFLSLLQGFSLGSLVSLPPQKQTQILIPISSGNSG